jgi:hypothetical protein
VHSVPAGPVQLALFVQAEPFVEVYRFSRTARSLSGIAPHAPSGLYPRGKKKIRVIRHSKKILPLRIAVLVGLYVLFMESPHIKNRIRQCPICPWQCHIWMSLYSSHFHSCFILSFFPTCESTAAKAAVTLGWGIFLQFRLCPMARADLSLFPFRRPLSSASVQVEHEVGIKCSHSLISGF